MASTDKIAREKKKDEAPSSLDQVLLDEFFSTIASVAIRLTKTDIRAINGANPAEQEVNDQ